MRSTLRFLPRNAAACALLALAPLTAYSQDASAPETQGIVVANMDRSVKPGDDFYRYANGGWLKRTEIPPYRRYIKPNGLDFCASNPDRRSSQGQRPRRFQNPQNCRLLSLLHGRGHY